MNEVDIADLRCHRRMADEDPTDGVYQNINTTQSELYLHNILF